MKLHNWKGFKDKRWTVDSVCKKYSIRNYEINDDGTINVNGGVYLRSKNLDVLPLIFKRVNGYFTCGYNRLTSLEGSPEVCTDFSCVGNYLKNLDGCPRFVYGNFNCAENELTTLIGCPEYVTGVFCCSYNKLYDVKGFPEGFSNPIDINHNPVFEIIKIFKNIEEPIIIDLLNDYNVIRGRKINLQLLKYVFDDLSIPFQEINFIEGYEII